jgi:hypothetical protein
MAYKTYEKVHGYEPRKGLEGPFTFGSGRVLYYDPIEGKYWDPRTDFYLSYEESSDLQAGIFTALRGK